MRYAKINSLRCWYEFLFETLNFLCFIRALLKVYDMRFELNEIEARREQYPSTVSFVNLLNLLIAEEKDLSDRGRR